MSRVVDVDHKGVRHCRHLDGHRGFDAKFRAYGPLTVLPAGADEEVSPVICRHLLERAKNAGSPVEFTVFAGATHGFDDRNERDPSSIMS
jgi:dienelactone hydrolase